MACPEEETHERNLNTGFMRASLKISLLHRGFFPIVPAFLRF
jgi:hypothetical protein